MLAYSARHVVLDADCQGDGTLRAKTLEVGGLKASLEEEETAGMMKEKIDGVDLEYRVYTACT